MFQMIRRILVKKGERHRSRTRTHHDRVLWKRQTRTIVVLNHRHISCVLRHRLERPLEQEIIFRDGTREIGVILEIRPINGEIHKSRMDVVLMGNEIVVDKLFHVSPLFKRRIHVGCSRTEQGRQGKDRKGHLSG